MTPVLTALALALAAVLFQYPLEERFVRPLQLGLLALLALSLLSAVLPKGKGRGKAEGGEAPPPAPKGVAPSPEAAVEAGVVQFLSRLQEKGRFVDFALDDITPYSNEQVGVAARVVHQGCREVLRECFDIRPLHSGEEQETVSLSGEYDATAYRLVGNVPEHPPYRGTVLHRGWKTTRVTLPRVAEAARKASAREVIAPAEVEIG
jgi:hypothetical protein